MNHPNPNPNPNLSLAEQQFLLMLQILGAPPQPQIVPVMHHPSPALIHPGMLPMQMQMLHNAVPAPFPFMQPQPQPVPAFPPAFPAFPAFPPAFPVQQPPPPPPPPAPPASAHHEDSAVLSVADEIILARAIYEKKGGNLEGVFLSLDGKNGHNVTKWMSYYVKNTHKIDQRMKALESHTSRNNVPSISHPTSVSSQPTTRQQARKKSGLDTVVTSRQSSSLHVQRAAEQSPPPRLRPQDASRVPTPPRNIIKTPQGGHKFTDEDVTYLRKVLACALMSDPDALKSRKTICAKLQANAPHHSANSWRRYLSKHEHVISEVRREVLSLDKEYDSSGSDEESSFNDSEEESIVDLSSSESEMGLQKRDINFKHSFGARATYLPSEQRALAKYIAQISLARWDNKPDSWISFQKTYSTHSLDQWRDWYRKHRDSVLRMARRFEVRMAKRKAMGREAARPAQSPTRPKPSSSFAGPSAPEKRAHEIDDDAFEPRPAKRSRTNSSGGYQLKEFSPCY